MPDLADGLELLSRVLDAAIRFLRSAEEYRLHPQRFRWNVITESRSELGRSLEPATAFVSENGRDLKLLHLEPNTVAALLGATQQMVRGQLVDAYRLIRESQLQAMVYAVEQARMEVQRADVGLQVRQKPVQGNTTRCAIPEWQPPADFVGTKEICNDAGFQKHGKNPPRTTIDAWIAAAARAGARPATLKAPDTGELFLPKAWVHQQISLWNPRKPKQET